MTSMPEAKPDGTPLTPAQVEAWRHNIRASTFANYHLKMGEALAAADSAGQAEWHLREAERLYPEAPDAALALSAWLTGQGRTSEAAAVDEAASRRDPRYPMQRLTQNLQNALPDDPARSLAELTDLGREAGHPVPDLDWRRGFLSLMLGDAQAAVELFGAHDADQILWPEAVVTFGTGVALSLYDRLSVTAAAIACRQVVALDPFREQIWLAVATMALGRRDWDNAIVAARRRQDLRPSDVYTQEVEILALLGQSRIEEAERLLSQRLAAGDAPPLLVWRTATVELAAGRFDAAERTLAEGLGQLPTDMWMNIDRALLCEMTKRPAEADAAVATAAATHGLPILARAVMRRSWLAPVLVPCLARNGHDLSSDMLAGLGLKP